MSSLTNTLQSRWGAKPNQKFFSGPKWARFRLFVQYTEGSAKYPSFDYHYSFANGIKQKHKSEAVGLQKLIEMAHTKTKQGKGYRYINIFANLTNNLDVNTGNFDYLVCTIVKGQITYKNPLYWMAQDLQMLDVKKIIEYKQIKNN